VESQAELTVAAMTRLPISLEGCSKNSDADAGRSDAFLARHCRTSVIPEKSDPFEFKRFFLVAREGQVAWHKNVGKTT
jgi:hypothetical protein